jgi:hypothetical protein
MRGECIRAKQRREAAAAPRMPNRPAVTIGAVLKIGRHRAPWSHQRALRLYRFLSVGLLSTGAAAFG